MEKDAVLNRLHETGVIAIFRVDSSDDCFNAMKALYKGGVRAFEITTTTPGSSGLVKEARKRYGDDVLIGMGTVLDAETAEKGIDAGAQFIVAPSLSQEVLAVCARNNIVSCPGTLTATEVVQAFRWGADLVKLFPASQLGPGYMKALMGPLPWIRFVPTGGIGAANAGEYIRAGAYCLGVGGSLVSKKAIAEGRFEQLTLGAADLLEAVRDARATC